MFGKRVLGILICLVLLTFLFGFVGVVSGKTTGGLRGRGAPVDWDGINESDKVAPKIISQCGTISEPGNYVLNQSLSTTGTCITITADDVVLDGMGYSVSFDGVSNLDFGIYVGVDITNVKIKNLNIIGYDYGVYLNKVNNSLLENLVFVGDGGEGNIGIYLFSKSNNNIITNNTVSLFQNGIKLIDESSNNLIINNRVSDVTYGIVTMSGSDNTIQNNIVSSAGIYAIYSNTELCKITNNLLENSGVGVYIDYVNNGVIRRNVFNSNNYGIYLMSSSNHVISGGTISNSAKNAIELDSDIELDGGGDDDYSYQSIPSLNNIFRDINILNTNDGYYDFKIDDVGVDQTSLVDMAFESYNFAGNLVTFKDTKEGEITFLQPISGSGTDLSTDVKINYNFAEVRSDLNNGLNKSANITLYGAPGAKFKKPIILKNGVPCEEGCYNYTSLKAKTVIFGVDSWTNYSIGEGGKKPCKPGWHRNERGRCEKDKKPKPKIRK